MITTSNPMSISRSCRPFAKRLIIAALLAASALTSGCGMAMKLAYNQGSGFAYRWLDGYADFNGEQTLRVRSGLDEWFAWHRRTQLPDYADLLASMRADIARDTTAAHMCRLFGEVRSRFDAALDHARPAIVDVLLLMKPKQLASVGKKQAERNEQYRDDYMQPDRDARRKAAVEREIDRSEKLYGRLDDAQRGLIATSVAASPFDAERSYAERLRRQQDALTVMRRLAAGDATRADADVEIRAYMARIDQSPRADYRRYAQQVIDHNCAFAASLHNSTSAEQRRSAADTLKNYEDDLRSLAGDA